ncbi:hypothetical protein AMIS_26010 [Actinoplanes missouriensis 431]|uniref:Uncharacterized protein n=1 Tax=Actinoplanes missouriensis (strain ATCC 14538 / DSM 43046 / CBS 188.64 / JCM 3121 / NBRC 102363 / NCIMB 12654 / NRRL B-3342 / UNCC 431) TaxID=512565 RepID=I0H484_ACTM4|nr:hypothetical protein AMIS_26010 [Actinoplanes missouriensis 431]
MDRPVSPPHQKAVVSPRAPGVDTVDIDRLQCQWRDEDYGGIAMPQPHDFTGAPGDLTVIVTRQVRRLVATSRFH